MSRENKITNAETIGKVLVGVDLDTTATSGIDKEIYDILVNFNWTDCIVS